MKLIINIPEETYKNTCDEKMLPPDVKNVVEAIKNSTPLEFGNISVEAIEELSHCPACIHYVQRDVPNVFCNNCKNRDELYRRIENENKTYK